MTIINLLCEQVAHEYSLGKIIFWFFNGCPCKCSMGDLVIMSKDKKI